MKQRGCLNSMIHRRLPFIAVLIALVLPVWGLGCADSQDMGESLAPESASWSLGMAPPTLDELTAVVSLTAEQRAVVEPALATWRASHEERVATRERRRAADGTGPGAGWGAGPHGGHSLDFLAACAGSLDEAQFNALVDFLAARREQHREAMAGSGRGRGPGMGHGPRMGAGLGTALGLSEAEAKAVHEAMRTAHEQLREAREQYAEGTIDATQVKDRATAVVSALETELRARLGEELFGTFAEHLRDRLQDRMEDRDRDGDRRHDHRAELLTKLLGLDESQVAAVSASFEEVRTQRDALHDAIAAGTVKFPDALYQGLLLHEAHRNALESILNERQRERLTKLHALHQGGPWGPGGPGVTIYF